MVEANFGSNVDFIPTLDYFGVFSIHIQCLYKYIRMCLSLIMYAKFDSLLIEYKCRWHCGR